MISIHAPQWGATIRRECGWHVMPFQSTHPVRGATAFCTALELNAEFQSTHPVRGATWTLR